MVTTAADAAAVTQPIANNKAMIIKEPAPEIQNCVMPGMAH
jgi:hypothetical protein